MVVVVGRVVNTMKNIKYSKCAKKWHRIQVLNSSWFRVISVMVGWIGGISLIVCGATLFDTCSRFEGVLLVFLALAIFITPQCLIVVLDEEPYQSYEDYQEYTSKREYHKRERKNKKWLI